LGAPLGLTASIGGALGSPPRIDLAGCHHARSQRL
jgi:hypothetical protein